MKKYNFYSGPAILPTEVFKSASDAVLEFANSGMSLIEISHRAKEFTDVLEEAQALVKEMTGLGDEYKVLFLQGGASMQFCMLPYNLLDTNASASYMDIGTWSKKAIKEAKLFGNVNVVCSSADKNYNYIPKGFSVPADSTYFHITTNETIGGTQMQSIPNSPVPLIADMSSDIFSREMDWKKYDMIYAGAQKNLGPSGATLVIIKESLLGKISRPIPSMLDYRVHIKDNSLYNTPSTFAIYVIMLTLRWMKAQGGLKAIQKTNEAKAAKLYSAIDASKLYNGVAAVDDRSKMNITWTLNKPELDDAFNKYAKENGCIGIKGHRSVGGFRASIYNAMPVSGIDTLIEVMKSFEQKNS